MTERVASDHGSIATYRAPLESIGRTDRVRVVLPTEEFESADVDETDHDLSTGDVVDLFLDGDRHYARIDDTLEGDLVLRRATDNRRQAREDDGENRLATWVSESDVRIGGSVHLDVVTPGHAFGLRTPGTRTVYRVTERPSDSLADIASDITDS